MAPVTPPVFEPAWLAVADIKEWLKLNAQDTADDAMLDAIAAACEPYVMRCRPDAFATDPDAGTVTVTDPEAYRGAVMYAAREYRRRNSPAGVEVFGDATSFVSRYDTDIERMLHTGAYAGPIVA